VSKQPQRGRAGQCDRSSITGSVSPRVSTCAATAATSSRRHRCTRAASPTSWVFRSLTGASHITCRIRGFTPHRCRALSPALNPVPASVRRLNWGGHLCLVVRRLSPTTLAPAALAAGLRPGVMAAAVGPSFVPSGRAVCWVLAADRARARPFRNLRPEARVRACLYRHLCAGAVVAFPAQQARTRLASAGERARALMCLSARNGTSGFEAGVAPPLWDTCSPNTFADRWVRGPGPTRSGGSICPIRFDAAPNHDPSAHPNVAAHSAATL
jgi:hypothetical protein